MIVTYDTFIASPLWNTETSARDSFELVESKYSDNLGPGDREKPTCFFIQILCLTCTLTETSVISTTW